MDKIAREVHAQARPHRASRDLPEHENQLGLAGRSWRLGTPVCQTLSKPQDSNAACSILETRSIQREVTHGMGVLWCAGRSERALDSSAARCYVHHSLVNTFHDTALSERCTETLLGNRLPAILSTAFEASSQNRHFTSFKRARQHLAIARRATHTETRGDPGCSRLSVFLFLLCLLSSYSGHLCEREQHASTWTEVVFCVPFWVKCPKGHQKDLIVQGMSTSLQLQVHGT